MYNMEVAYLNMKIWMIIPTQTIIYIFTTGLDISFLILYKDNVYLTRDDEDYIQFMKTYIKKELEMTDMGLLSCSLGLKFYFLSEGIVHRVWIGPLQAGLHPHAQEGDSFPLYARS